MSQQKLLLLAIEHAEKALVKAKRRYVEYLDPSKKRPYPWTNDHGFRDAAQECENEEWCNCIVCDYYDDQGI